MILRITISIFVGPECMCDTFDWIDNGAGKIVGGIHLPLIAISQNQKQLRTAKSEEIYPVRWWGSVLTLYMTGSRRALLLSSTLILARRHHREPSLEPVVISSNCLRLSSTLSSLCFEGIPFPRIYNPIRECISSIIDITDLQLFSVIGIGLAIFDELNGIVVDCLEIIGCVRYDVTLDIKKFQILQYGFLKLSL